MKTKGNILHLEREAYPSKILESIEHSFDVTYASFEDQDRFDEFLQGKDFEIVFTKLGLHLGKNQIDTLKSLSTICTPTTGYNHIDVEYASAKGINIIGLKNEKEFLAQVKSTAEHTWALLLAIARNLYAAIDTTQKKAEWNRIPYKADELSEKTLGIIGYGRLGKIVAQYGIAFGMKILAHDIDESVFVDLPTEVKSCNLNTLLEKSDYVILLISWNQENNHFMDGVKLNSMKKTAYLINTSRGELLDEKALLSSLKEKKLNGAALDVLEGDSIWDPHQKVSNELLAYASKNDNLIITPHMGGYGKSSIEKTRVYLTNLFLNQYK